MYGLRLIQVPYQCSNQMRLFLMRDPVRRQGEPPWLHNVPPVPKSVTNRIWYRFPGMKWKRPPPLRWLRAISSIYAVIDLIHHKLQQFVSGIKNSYFSLERVHQQVLWYFFQQKVCIDTWLRVTWSNRLCLRPVRTAIWKLSWKGISTAFLSYRW